MSIKRGSNQELGSNIAGTGIVVAAMENNYDLVLSILSTVPAAVNEQDALGVSAMMAAAGRGHIRIVRLLSDSSKIIWSLMDQEGQTALDYAYGQREVLEHIVECQFGNMNLGRPEIV